MARKGQDLTGPPFRVDGEHKAGLGSKRLVQINPCFFKRKWEFIALPMTAVLLLCVCSSHDGEVCFLARAVPTITGHSHRGNRSGDITLTLQHKSSSSSRGPLVLEAARTPVQHMPRLLSDITQGLACSGSCSLLLALGRPLSPLPGGLLC